MDRPSGEVELMPYVSRNGGGKITGFARWRHGDFQEFLAPNDPELLAHINPPRPPPPLTAVELSEVLIAKAGAPLTQADIDAKIATRTT